MESLEKQKGEVTEQWVFENFMKGYTIKEISKVCNKTYMRVSRIVFKQFYKRPMYYNEYRSLNLHNTREEKRNALLKESKGLSIEEMDYGMYKIPSYFYMGGKTIADEIEN